MTVSHRTPPLPATSLAGALGTLRARGLRVSAARRLVLECLFAVERPVTAEEVASGLGGRFPAQDLGSVYRNLETLEELGLLRHFHVGHGPGRYALMRAGEVEFVACEHCGAVEVVEPGRLDPVRALVEAELGYRPRFTHFPLIGACPACRNDEEHRHAHP